MKRNEKIQAVIVLTITAFISVTLLYLATNYIGGIK